ncbi:MAG: hypothetical protein AAGA55_09330 [Planctomycetota bacterium]
MGEGKKVALVGHCGPDSFLLVNAVRSAVPGAEVIKNTDEKDLWETGAELLLVNRVLDGFYADDHGLRIIREAVSRGVAAMIISNYEDAQDAAVAAGGRPGFGKTDVRSDKAHDAIRSALGLD